MSDWTFYPVFVATAVSIGGLTHLTIRNHDLYKPRNLSELAAAEQNLLVRFRNILLVCGLLFAVTVFGYIVPRVPHAELTAVFGGLMIGGELLVALLPARDKTRIAHYVVAQVMSAGMLGLAVLFLIDLEGWHRWLAAAFVVMMSIFGSLTFLNKQRFIIYELVFIFASHGSILVAAHALAQV